MLSAYASALLRSQDMMNREKKAQLPAMQVCNFLFTPLGLYSPTSRTSCSPAPTRTCTLVLVLVRGDPIRRRSPPPLHSSTVLSSPLDRSRRSRRRRRRSSYCRRRRRERSIRIRIRIQMWIRIQIQILRFAIAAERMCAALCAQVAFIDSICHPVYQVRVLTVLYFSVSARANNYCSLSPYPTASALSAPPPPPASSSTSSLASSLPHARDPLSCLASRSLRSPSALLFIRSLRCLIRYAHALRQPLSSPVHNSPLSDSRSLPAARLTSRVTRNHIALAAFILTFTRRRILVYCT